MIKHFLIISTLLLVFLFCWTYQVSGFFNFVSQKQIASFKIADHFSEVINNGSFEDQLQGWELKGFVEIDDDEIVIHKVKIGSQDQEFQQNGISQDLSLDPDKKYFLWLVYKLKINETLAGFDQPAFMVLIDEKPVFYTQESTLDWQQLLVPLPLVETGKLELIVQNTGDLLITPELEIAYISTDGPLRTEGVPLPNVAKTIAQVEQIAEIEYIQKNPGTILKFSTPTTQFPVFSYQITSDSSAFKPKFSLRTNLNSTQILLPTIHPFQELLLLDNGLTSAIYTFSALDAHDQVLAVGTLIIE